MVFTFICQPETQEYSWTFRQNNRRENGGKVTRRRQIRISQMRRIRRAYENDARKTDSEDRSSSFLFSTAANAILTHHAVLSVNGAKVLDDWLTGSGVTLELLSGGFR